MNIVARTVTNISTLQKVVKGVSVGEDIPEHHQYLSIIFPSDNYFLQALMDEGYGQVSIWKGKILLTINRRDLRIMKQEVQDTDVLHVLESIK